MWTREVSLCSSVWQTVLSMETPVKSVCCPETLTVAGPAPSAPLGHGKTPQLHPTHLWPKISTNGCWYSNFVYFRCFLDHRPGSVVTRVAKHAALSTSSLHPDQACFKWQECTLSSCWLDCSESFYLIFSASALSPDNRMTYKENPKFETSAWTKNSTELGQHQGPNASVCVCIRWLVKYLSSDYTTCTVSCSPHLQLTVMA